MAYDEGLAERVRDALRDQPGIVEKRMFGGLAFMWRGHMLAGVLGDALMARVGPQRYAEALRAPHAREMDFTGRPLAGFVVVAPEGCDSDAALARWLAQCAEFVATLPPKA